VDFQGPPRESDNKGKSLMFIFENSKLTKQDMVFRIIKLEFDPNDDIVYLKNKILTKIGNVKGVRIIKHIYFLDGQEVKQSAQLSGPCDIFIVSSQSIFCGLNLDNSYIPNFE